MFYRRLCFQTPKVLNLTSNSSRKNGAYKCRNLYQLGLDKGRILPIITQVQLYSAQSSEQRYPNKAKFITLFTVLGGVIGGAIFWFKQKGELKDHTQQYPLNSEGKKDPPTEPPTASPKEPPTESPKEPPTESPKEPPTESPPEKTFLLEEVARHNNKGSGIWVTYGNNVYDITEFVDVHPGGDQILQAAGKAIEPFWDIYAVHKTPEVAEILAEFKIGVIDPADQSKREVNDDPYKDDPTRDPALLPHTVKPFNAETCPKTLIENYITPNKTFYVRNHLPVPKVDPETYQLEIQGEGVYKPINISLTDLKNKFPKHKVISTITCAGNRRAAFNTVKEVKGLPWGLSAIGSCEWTGVYLVDILKHFDIDIDNPQIRHVQFEGLDHQPDGKNYGASVPSSKVLDPRSEVLLAFEMNGEDIPPDHGFPVRVIIPGVVGARNVKWLSKVILSDKESPSFWQQNDYKVFSSSTTFDDADYTSVPAIQEVPVNSAICDPQDGDSVSGKFKLKGYAWSGGGRDIVRVDVSIDGGKNWIPAKMKTEKENKWAWKFWEVEISALPESGSKMEIICKAVDSSYNVQPETYASVWNIRGLLNNGWHRITLNVT